MSPTLDITQQSFIRAMQGRGTREQTLNVVIVRLLGVALMVTNWRQPQGQTATLPVPHHYRTWPMVESEVDSPGRRQRLRFYV
jgi:hypothetical protein